MTQKIIYPTDDGGVVVLTPTPEYLENHTIEEVAAKDVPEGTPYKIVDNSEIPTDRTFRNAWEYSSSVTTQETPVSEPRTPVSVTTGNAMASNVGTTTQPASNNTVVHGITDYSSYGGKSY